ncbi:hypothetical protein MIDIC_10038 [Alphaproteobacteria bacterium]
MEEKEQKDFYFDQSGIITTKLGITQVPAVVKQNNKQLLIKEIWLEEGKRNESN